MKTIKDIKPKCYDNKTNWIDEDKLKAEVVEWVKQDKKVLKIIHPTQYKLFDGYMKLWMERLDITDEDLK